MHKIKTLFLFIFIIVSSLRGDIITSQLINKTHKTQWYMFQSNENNITYLVNNRDSLEADGIRVWNFTTARKWRPISNASGFDGFVGAAKNFKSISISDDGKEITFGEKAISKNIPLDTFLNDLANKKFDIQWYYWKTENGFPFLLFNRDNIAGISIYQHTASGKWKPIHNAKAFDGYPSAKSVFDIVSISGDGREIDIVYNKFNIPTIKDILPRETITREFRISSNDFSDDSYKNDTRYSFTKNPHIDWANTPASTQSLALEIINLSDKKALWRAVNIPVGDSNSSFIKEDATIDYKKMVTLENDYDFKKEFYSGTNHSGLMPEGNYLLTLYALSIKKPTSMADAKRNAIEYVNMVFKR